MKKWDKANDRHLLQYLDGMPQKTIAKLCEQFGCTGHQIDTAINRLRREAGIRLRRTGRDWDAIENGQLVAMRERGMFWKDIGRILNRHDTVCRNQYEKLVLGEVSMRPEPVTKNCSANRIHQDGYEYRCNAPFTYDRSRSQPLFMCPDCRARSTSPMALMGGGSTGRHIGAYRAP